MASITVDTYEREGESEREGAVGALHCLHSVNKRTTCV